MQAGKLRNAITIVEPGTAKDEFNQTIPGATRVVLNCMAAIAAVSGKEVYALGAGFSGQVTHKITIRKPVAAIRAGMTVCFGARSFLVQVSPMDPDERGRELDLICLEQNG